MLPSRCLVLLLAGTLHAQSLPVEVANLREDVRGLAQRLGELALRIEQLERENAELRGQLAAAGRAQVTLAQLREGLAESAREARAAVAASKAETLQQVATQMEKLAKQTNAALESLARTNGARVPAAGFSEDFPREGISYTVQKGDTLAVIARKTGARPQDIINANKLADPSRIQAGQVLFIPGGK